MIVKEFLEQSTYKEAIRLFKEKSEAFDKAAQAYKDNDDKEKEEELAKASRSAWALYSYYMSNMFYLAETIKNDDINLVTEAAKEIKQIVFNDLQQKYEFIMETMKPQNL